MKRELKTKHFGRITTYAITLMVVVVLGWAVLPASRLQAVVGSAVGENKIPLDRDKASAPYAVFQAWLSGDSTGRCFDGADNTLKASATYANCAIRAERDSVTRLWWITVPAELPGGTYLVIIRDGADGAEANTDTGVATICIVWSAVDQTFYTTTQNVFSSY